VNDSPRVAIRKRIVTHVREGSDKGEESTKETETGGEGSERRRDQKKASATAKVKRRRVSKALATNDEGEKEVVFRSSLP
jgi:hypothetical protein